MKTGLVIFPGINRERDMVLALQQSCGAAPRMLWHKDTDLGDLDLIVIPGGFSFGDYLRCGAMAAQSPVMRAVRNHAARGGYGGPSRNDANAARLVELLTQPPVLVWRTTRKRESANFPHTPAFATAYLSNPERAALHPSADAIVARALADAWDARAELGLDAAHQALIKRAVGAVAQYEHGGCWARLDRHQTETFALRTIGSWRDAASAETSAIDSPVMSISRRSSSGLIASGGISTTVSPSGRMIAPRRRAASVT